ncbi:MAG: 4-hydroxy-tetrahydrodipicolinate synthase [Candidatus Kapaibacterium sp.]
MKKFLLKGTYTALVTPFYDDGSIDFETLKEMIDFQIDSGIDGIVVCGSTGESATLTVKEKMSLIIQSVEYSAGRVPVIAGTGTNSTQASIDMTIIAREHGADAVLLVAPYYNKPSQEGLFEHYAAISDSVDIPQIIYNIPGRSCVNILPETQLRLAEECENIVATKEASGSLEQMTQICKYAPEGFSVISGDDALTLPLIAVGGAGVIAVTSNYAPRQLGDMVKAALAGDFETARRINMKLFDLMQLNMVETNPVPVKAALSVMGKMEDIYRMPLLKINDRNRAKIEQALRNADIIK